MTVEEIKTFIKTSDYLKQLTEVVNAVIERLVDEEFFPEVQNGLWEYPKIIFSKKETL